MSTITVETLVNAPLQKVWDYYTSTGHITKWNFASDDWHCPHAENDLKVGGKFSYRMEAKDGSFGFSFGGTYTKIEPSKLIAYTIEDNRQVTVIFSETGSQIKVIVTFETEKTHTEEIQREGWQSILDNSKNHTENN